MAQQDIWEQEWEAAAFLEKSPGTRGQLWEGWASPRILADL